MTSNADQNPLTYSSSPYYLSNNDHPERVLTPFLLTGDNYEKWAKIARNNLRAKNKLGFIDGSLKKPDSSHADHPRWEQTNAMLSGWLYASLDAKVQKNVSFVEDAKSLWETLKVRYSIGNASRVHELKTSIAGCAQDGQEVADYFGKLKALWDDLDDYEPMIDCCCSNSTCPQRLKQTRRRDHERIHQFLMGLNASIFGTTRTNILGRLNRDTNVTLDHVYSEIVNEERHQTVARSKEERTTAVSFAVKSGITAINSAPRTPTPPCTQCGRTNHTVETCFEIHGLPEWWLEKYGDTRGTPRPDASRGRGRGTSRGRGRGRSASPRVNNAQVASSFDSSEVPGVSKETWSAIVNLLKSDTVSTEKLSGKTKCVDFLLDSGASHHMTGDVDLLTDTYDIPHSVIVLPNGKHTYATKQGTMVLGDNISLTRVLFVPDLSCTLISLARLLRELSCVALFTDKLCVIQDLTSKMVIGAGEERDGVYHFRGSIAATANHVGSSVTKTLWHQRLGHPSKRILSTFLSTLEGFNDHCSGFEDFCDVCVQAKQTRAVFPDSYNKADECFSLIHCDVWGPYKTASSSGAHYFLTIVDDYSRAVWTHLLLAKSEVASCLKEFLALVSRQFNKSIKTIRSDNGTEFLVLRQFFKDNGIQHQTSCVYTPQQNGRVERKHRHILNMARSLLFQAHLPIKFWGESILTASYLINRTPTPLLNGCTPFEMLYSTPPSSSHLRVFGCLCFAKRHSSTRDKFQERSRRCIFVGYPHNQKAWRVYDLEHGDFFVSRDVIFRENEFPYEVSAVPSSSIPPLPPSLDYVDDSLDDITAPPLQNRGSLPADPVVPSPVISDDTEDQVPITTVDTSTTTADHDLDTEPLGRGLREKKRSVLLEPYVTYHTRLENDPISLSSTSSTPSSGKCVHPLADFVSCDRFSPAHQQFLANVILFDEPITYKQAFQIAEWRKAMRAEIDALELNETWTLEALPPGAKALGSKWVYRLKFNSDGSLERHKARLVALGNHQKEGVDFNETFAPVTKMDTVRLLLSVAAVKNWELHQMDVHNAFLHGDLDEVIYMKPPPGFHNGDPNLVCKLKKSIYGLRQSPRCWFSKLSTALLDYGFTKSHKDNSLFSYKRGSIILHVLVYVDDLIVCGNDPAILNSFKSYLSRCFKMKDLGFLKYFLGLEVSRGPDGIFLSQRKYCLDIIEECGLSGSRPVDTPLEQNHKLLTSSSAPFASPDRYRRLVGRLVYLTHTKPEISYAVNILAQFMQTPLQDHWESAFRLVKYLKSAPGQGIVLSSKSSLQVNAYCDSDFNTCPITRRSLTGYMVLLGDSPISWKTKKQSRVSLSSAEAEYRSMAMTCKELLWIKEVLSFLGVDHSHPMRLHCDSQAALHIAANPVFHERTKHIEGDCHFIRDEIQAGVISTSYVSTTQQPADIFTKALGRDQFQYLRSKLGIHNLHAPS